MFLSKDRKDTMLYMALQESSISDGAYISVVHRYTQNEYVEYEHLVLLVHYDMPYRVERSRNSRSSDTVEEIIATFWNGCLSHLRSCPYLPPAQE